MLGLWLRGRAPEKLTFSANEHGSDTRLHNKVIVKNTSNGGEGDPGRYLVIHTTFFYLFI